MFETIKNIILCETIGFGSFENPVPLEKTGRKGSFGVFDNISVLLTAVRCLITTVFVFSFFEVLPQYPLGVSEVHFIFGATLFLFFGAGATAFGLVAGLSLQGLLLAPSDLPQLYINISTLLFPLFAVSYISKKIIPANIAYTDLKYRHVISLTDI